MNYTDAQNLLGVPRYVSQVELRKKYIALIKIHHPDVNADKKRANKLTSDIIEAYEVFLKHRDQEKWKEKDTETKTANGSFGNNKNANHRSQPEENYGIWEKQSKQTPLSKNLFWQSTFVSNFDLPAEDRAIAAEPSGTPVRLGVDYFLCRRESQQRSGIYGKLPV